MEKAVRKRLRGLFSVMGAVFCAVMAMMICQTADAIYYNEKTATVDYDYQVDLLYEGEPVTTAVRDMFRGFTRRSSGSLFTT